MDEFDKFVRDGLFEEQRHFHRFEEGETQRQREDWLSAVDTACKASNIQYVVRETMRHGYPAYEFGFSDAEAFAAFRLTLYGDSNGCYRQTHTFEDVEPGYKEAFLSAADAYLGALGIECRARQRPGAIEFTFNKFSEQRIFQTLIDEGTIDGSAKAIVRARTLQKRMQSGPAQDSSDAKPNFE